jgi:outer membrane protein OmpA-like peptidoglycan-associated protein
VGYDTSSVLVTAPATHWAIDIVRGANTSVNEWMVRTSGESWYMIAGTRAATALPVAVRRVSKDSVRRISDPAPFTILTSSVDSLAIAGDASIVEAQLTFKGLENARALGNDVNRSVAWDAQPALSTNGSVLVFASDRQGSIGGADLWYSVRTPDGFSIPQQIRGVNTACDEVTPFIADGDSVLYFASAGHTTVGGYDLFRARITSLPTTVGQPFEVSDIQNIGIPVNTAADELFPFVPFGERDVLYYGSNQRGSTREHLGDDYDVYVLHRKPGRTIATPTQPERPVIAAERIPVSGVVLTEDTRDPVVNAPVTARDDATREVYDSARTDTAGRYTVNIPPSRPVEITAQDSVRFYDRTVVQVPPNTRDTVAAPPLALPVSYFLRINFPTAIFDAPYETTLDSNGVETQQRWQDAIELLATNIKLSGSSVKRVVLIGHTDDVDDDASNMKLGKQRVDFVIDQLVQRGVPRALLEGRSAGERLKPTKRPSESQDTWRKRSRRVELVKVTGATK